MGCVVLLSGGLDSAVVLAECVALGYNPVKALTFSYGQRHRIEISYAAKLAQRFGVSHRVVDIDPAVFGVGSPLIQSSTIPVPKGRQIDDSIAPTYVPARNTVFLSLALAYAESNGLVVIAIGANALDFSGYPDCKPDYFAAFRKLAALGTRNGAEIFAPLLHFSKQEIATKATEYGISRDETWSCYDPQDGGKPCGRCDSCQLRNAAFAHQ